MFTDKQTNKKSTKFVNFIIEIHLVTYLRLNIILFVCFDRLFFVALTVDVDKGTFRLTEDLSTDCKPSTVLYIIIVIIITIICLALLFFFNLQNQNNVSLHLLPFSSLFTFSLSFSFWPLNLTKSE